MRPSVQKSMLLAVGLAVSASTLETLGREASLSAGPAIRPPRLPPAEAGAAGPKLILLPPVSVPASAGQPLLGRVTGASGSTTWTGEIAAHARTATSAKVQAVGTDTARAEFLRRAQRLVAAGLPRGQRGP